MSRVFSTWCFALVAGCSFTPREGQFLCAAPDERCPDGFSCVAGRCVSGDPDDAATPDLDAADARGLDAFAAPPDAFELDAFGADAFVEAPDAGVLETCSTGARRRPVDEDGDGFVDERCPYTLAQPHHVLAAMPVAGQYLGADLTSDGLSMFSSTTSAGAPVFVAYRDSIGQRFVAQPPLTATSIPGRSTDSLTVRGDGGELILESTDGSGVSRLYTSTVADLVFGPPTEIVALRGMTTEEAHPYLRRDGRELYFVRRPTTVATPSEIYVTRRTRLSDPWDAPTTVGAGSRPTLSPDGGTLFYSDEFGSLRYTERASLDASFVIGDTDATLAHPSAGRSIARFVYFPDGREAYFLHRNAGLPETVPPDAPQANSIFRVQVCRAGSCDPDLGTGCAAILSDDRLHCYRQLSGSVAYDAATTSCGAEEHLVSLHSAQEASVIRSTWLNAWLGLRGTEWQSGEPFLYEEFAGPNPLPTECAHTTWAVVSCTTPPRSPICERDHWPQYVD